MSTEITKLTLSPSLKKRGTLKAERNHPFSSQEKGSGDEFHWCTNNLTQPLKVWVRISPDLFGLFQRNPMDSPQNGII